MREIAQWPLRDVLVAYVERLKDSTRHSYEVALGVWASRSAFGGKSKPPEVPALLR